MSTTATIMKTPSGAREVIDLLASPSPSNNYPMFSSPPKSRRQLKKRRCDDDYLGSANRTNDIIDLESDDASSDDTVPFLMSKTKGPISKTKGLSSPATKKKVNPKTPSPASRGTLDSWIKPSGSVKRSSLHEDDDNNDDDVKITGIKAGNGKRRSRSRMEKSRIDDNDDDDDVEIIIPSRRLSSSTMTSAAAATSTTKRIANDINDWISRIRDVFPLVSRAKVEKLLNKAKSFTTDNDEEDAYHTVMTVLAECGDPTGTTISDASFAAVSVGRDRDGDEDNSKLKSTSPGKKRAGQRKVATLECKCCYVEYEFESMVSCRSGHLFCGTCLQKHTEQRVFGIGNFGVKPTEGQQTSKALEILCMTSGCASGFREGQLRKALSDKVMKKYDELQFAAVIESAQMKDVFKCSKCQYIAVRDESLPPLLFNCPQCLFKSCTECGEEFHPKIRCDQVESKNETDGRTKVEEAMTLALVRICPKPLCKKKILKNEGCNKMTCACGTLLCYVCGKEILSTVGYKHFCQTPHCQHKSCNKCPLYVDTTESDKAKVIAAAKDAAKSVAKKANVDVDSLVKGLSPSKDPPPFTFQVVCPATLPVTRAIQVIHPITKQKINLVVPVGVQPGGIFAVRVTNKAAPAPPQQPPARQQLAQQAQAIAQQAQAIAQQAQAIAQQAQATRRQLAQQAQATRRPARQQLAQQNAQNHVKRQRKKG